MRGISLAFVVLLCAATPAAAGILDLGPLTLETAVNPNGTPNLGTGLLVSLDLEGLDTFVSLNATATGTVQIDAPITGAGGFLMQSPKVQRIVEANLANLVEGVPGVDYTRDDSQWSNFFTTLPYASSASGGEAGNDVTMHTATIDTTTLSTTGEDIGYFVTTGGIELSGTAYVGIKMETVVALPGDANTDGVVNGLDKGIISHDMITPETVVDGDVNFDGVLDGLDANIFSRTFLEDEPLDPPLLDVTGFRQPFHVFIATDGTITNLLPDIPGDANLDGVVNGLDANMVSADFLEDVIPFTNGDLNGDGVVNGLDANIVSSNFLSGPPATAIPEPSTFALGMALLSICATSRRRGRSR